MTQGININRELTIVQRLAYDKEYERAIRTLCRIIQSQQKEIDKLKNKEAEHVH